jgi:hypothetical protein
MVNIDQDFGGIKIQGFPETPFLVHRGNKGWLRDRIWDSRHKTRERFQFLSG